MKHNSTPYELFPNWHPLAHIDNFIMACGWTHDGEGFVPPDAWREAMSVNLDSGTHWRRDQAASLCIQYLEARHNVNTPTAPTP